MISKSSFCTPIVTFLMAIGFNQNVDFTNSRTNAEESVAPSVVRIREFDRQQLQDPEPLFWPAYFWLWNGPLEPNVLRSQLQDMAAHQAKSVCVLPMPRDFRPETTANGMDVDYLSTDFFDRVKVAVEESSRLGMHYWLYDEGGWPSGQATGRVIGSRPDLALQVLRADPEGKWSVYKSAARPDLLNPATTETFISLTHEKYRDAVGSHFGKTIQLVFTDEPAYPFVQEGREVPWTTDLGNLFAIQFGYRLEDRLPSAFRRVPAAERTPADLKTRIDAFDFWSQRFRQTYFELLRDWCRRHGGLAHGGHLGGEDETLGAAKFGFGQVMRQMRAMDIPSVDTIWRQLYPGRRNHHFPKFASSAAHQNGTALAMTESFCVYGNGLTPAQMKWLIDYQYVRGMNVLVAGCYPLSTQEHHMLGERPHFGAVDPLWDHLPKFHRYVARLGYLLSCGEPVIDTALYYPVRDIWAKGAESTAVETHDTLAQELFERQCDFDIIDDDLLDDPRTSVKDGRLYAGKMKYRTIVIGHTEQMSERGRQRLSELERVGGVVIRAGSVADASQTVQQATSTIDCNPASNDLRCQVRRWDGGGVAFLFNEGTSAWKGNVTIGLTGVPVILEPSEGTATQILEVVCQNNRTIVPLTLGAGESLIVLFDKNQLETSKPPFLARRSVALDVDWEARAIRHHRVGPHNYEVLKSEEMPYQPIALGTWNELVGSDFSGVVRYRRRVTLPADWIGKRLRLSLGKVDYSARVHINAREIGTAQWYPADLEFTLPERSSEFELNIEVANTLASELTSERVQKEWSQRKGPGWPGPYHVRALEFEKESRSGGLFGPVTIEVSE